MTDNDNRSDDEFDNLFTQVLNDAMAADAEIEDAMVSEMEASIRRSIMSGKVVIPIQEIDGQEFVCVPSAIMLDIIMALNEAVEISNEVNVQAAMGNAAIMLSGWWSDMQARSLATKSAFITAAHLMFHEAKGEV